ncbi:serine hydrolase domain-containing protein [Pacificimonas flava]|uniref:Beta-lactamase class C n=1 Tax=Pacificimonas flava TaxID=1234595 RepID=M2TJ96_9SPHN|nr:serine hydrolase [Pacificimonas flava]EMD81716.1 Beta-lactamase class C [Pacificimonas flava]MBB5281719.1 CubicO group peptidase (beta-lactamase class C family) [Pacificimonas flava]
MKTSEHALETRLEAGFAPLARAIEEGRVPGGALGIIDVEGRRAIEHAGHAALYPEPVILRRDHAFDLASLTKVMVTTRVILDLVEEGRLHLDMTLAELIPDLRQYDVKGAPERRLTLRQCLTHNTHLPAVEPLYTNGQDPETLRAFVLQREWRGGPPVYSDVNFLMLGIAIERVTGAPFRALPLPPGLSFGTAPDAAVATEYCTWRGRIIRGEVHDENAYAFGGVMGHAGLFGTVDAVLDFAAGLLSGRDASPAALAEIRTRQPDRRTLGWERKYDGWHGGSRCSDETIGHTGFTGTGLWIDWERGLGWTLLTNRVHPTRHSDSGILELRQAVCDAVVTAARET